MLTDHLTLTDFNQHVGRRIKAARLQAGHSQEDLGKLLGLTFQQIQKYEKGSNRISLENLWCLCRELDIEIAFFLPDLEEARSAQAPPSNNRSSNRLRLEIGRAVQSISSAQLLRNILNIVRSLAETPG